MPGRASQLLYTQNMFTFVLFFLSFVVLLFDSLYLKKKKKIKQNTKTTKLAFQSTTSIILLIFLISFRLFL